MRHRPLTRLPQYDTREEVLMDRQEEPSTATQEINVLDMCRCHHSRERHFGLVGPCSFDDGGAQADPFGEGPCHCKVFRVQP